MIVGIFHAIDGRDVAAHVQHQIDNGPSSYDNRYFRFIFEKDYYWYLSAYIFFSTSPDSLSRQMWPRLSAPTVTMWPLFGFVSSANVPHPEKDLSCILVLLAWRRRFFSVSQIRKSPQQELSNIESEKLRQGKLQRVIQEIPVRNGKTFERLWSSRTL